jgi:nicotinamidase-related amidase
VNRGPCSSTPVFDRLGGVGVQTALVVIDAQTSLIDEGPWEAQFVLDRINRLIAAARTAGAKVVFLRDLRVEPDGSIHPRLARQDGDCVIEKRFSDSFLGTNLEEVLTTFGATRIVVCGLQTDYCVDTTSRRAVSVGFDVVLAADAHTTFDHEHLRAEQIVAHHNRILRNFSAGAHRVSVVDSQGVSFH